MGKKLVMTPSLEEASPSDGLNSLESHRQLVPIK